MPVLGLVSDTHLPQRCDALPPGLFEALRGVDLVLHCGDAGELWALDQLGAIAPVVAVHGNDDTADAQRALPRQLAARLTLEPGQPPRVEHVDLADPPRVFRPEVDVAAGFRANALRFSSSILDPALSGRWDALRRALPDLLPLEVGHEVILRLARRVWRGQQEWITLPDLLAELEAEPRVPADVAARLRELAAAPPGDP